MTLFEFEHKGDTLAGRYELTEDERPMMTVWTDFGQSDTTQLGELQPLVLARMLARETTRGH